MFKKFSLALLIPLIILVLLRIPSLFESYWYGDEAIYAAVAQEMKQGKLLYAETWDHKPPLIFWFFYPAAVIGWGAGFVTLRAVNIILGVLTLIIINRILKKYVKNIPRFIALLFLSVTLGTGILEGNVVNAEVIFIVFNTLAFLLLLEKRQFLLVGFLAYLSLATKVPGFVEVAFLIFTFLIVYLKENGFKLILKSVPLIAVGFIVPFLLTLLYFWQRGTFADFLYANAIFNRLYSMHEGNFIELAGYKLPATYLQAPSVLSVFIFSLILYQTKKISSFIFVLINLFTIQFFATLLSAKNYGHYFIQMLPSVSIIIALFLNNPKRLFRPWKIMIIVVLLLVLTPLFYSLKLGGKISVYAPPKIYYPTFIKGYLLGDEKQKEKFWWGSGRGVKKVKSAADYFSNNHLEYDKAYIYTDKPWVQALAGRDLTNKYVVWFHLAYRKEHLEEEIENIKKADLLVVDNDTRKLKEVLEIVDTYYKFDEYENFSYYRRYSE
jgi:hypothetical protein